MALSPLQKSLLTSICASSVLFGISAAPLAIFRTQPIEVQIKNKTVLESEVSNLAGPYLAISGAICAALSFGVLGVSGWRSAASKSEVAQGKNSALENSLLACKAELERIKFSESRLKAENLGEFIRPDMPAPVHQKETALQRLSEVPEPQPVVVSQNQFASSNGRSAKNGLQPVPLRTIVNDHPVQLPLSYHQPANCPEEMSFLIHEGLYANNEQEKKNQPKVTSQESPIAMTDHGNGHEKQLGLMLDQLKELMSQVESLKTNSETKIAA
jgi:hypothetical protein